MTRANELLVGTWGIGIVTWEVMRSPMKRRFGGLRANGQEITVYLTGANPGADDRDSFRTIAKHIAETGLWGTCSHGVQVVVIKRDHRTEDVRLEDWFTYKNPVL